VTLLPLQVRGHVGTRHGPGSSWHPAFRAIASPKQLEPVYGCHGGNGSVPTAGVRWRIVQVVGGHLPELFEDDTGKD
jgi:hypothetical protein